MVTTKPAPLQGKEKDALQAFLKLINAWQKASPSEAVLDIPHAQIRAFKRPRSEIHFYCTDPKTGESTPISAPDAFSRLHFKGVASVFVSPRGIPTLLEDPPMPAMAATHKRFAGVLAKDAPEATFPDPPSAPAKRVLSTPQRTPLDADKRFLAHDILRALGKGQMSAEEEASLRYAKRRALEASGSGTAEVMEPSPFVTLPVRPVNSNESSAKTTPTTSRASSPALSLAVAARTRQVPLFLPPDSSPPMPVPESFAKAKSRVASSAGKSRAASTASNRPASPTFYVLVPPTPEYVRRYQARMRAQREQEEMPIDLLDQEVEVEPEIDMRELKRQRALGMKQPSKVCRAHG